LNTGLTDVERDDFPHTGGEMKKKKSGRGLGEDSRVWVSHLTVSFRTWTRKRTDTRGQVRAFDFYV